MNKNLSKSLSKTVIFAVIIAVSTVIFAVAATFFMLYVYGQLTSVTDEYVEEITARKTDYVNTLIKNDLNLVENLSSSLSDYENIDKETLDSTLKRIADINGYLNFILIKPSGEVVSYRGEKMNVKDRLYFQNAMKGKTYISPPIFSNPDNSMANAFSAPVYKDGEIVGAVAGLRKTSDYSDEINLAVRGVENNANGYIVHTDGDILISGTKLLDDDVLPDDSHSFFDCDFLKAAGENAATEMADAFSKKDVSGSLKASVGEKDYILYYTDLKADSDLHYVVIYDESTVFSDLFRYMESTVVMYIVFLGVIAVMALAYFFVMRTNLRSLRNANELTSKIAYEDRVTGYGTYGKFEEDAQELIKHDYRKYCIVSFDIDKFKAVNDMFGHEEGNRMLKVVAETVQRNLLDWETFARVNSDNFFILLSYKDDNEITDKIKKLISAISYEFSDYVPVLSFGIYKIVDKSMSIRRMGDCADIARRTVKYGESSSFAFYTDTMLESMREEKAIENEMQNALDTHEFALYLQPKFSLSGPPRLTGAEALVRWIRKGSVVSPGKFIPLFERNRFIIKLDYYILDQVCRRLKKWESEGIANILISVNMSRVHLRDPGFVDKLQEICHTHGIEPSRIEIEITESAAYDSMDVLIEVVNDLKSRGFHISIDDFGSGYSSLNMLKDLPVDVLKIDRMFLTETNNKRANDIIRHVIKMAQSLGMETICEGIETDEQAQLLRSLGCDMAQGFFFAKPMPCDDFERVIERSHKIKKS